MVQERWETVWERSRAGRHTVVIGPHTLPPAPSDVQVLHVRCDTPGSSGGALEAAYRHVAQLLGEAVPAPEPAPLERGARQRFLGDMPGPPLDARLVEACNRLASRTGGSAVLAFEAIDAADEATVATLAQILQRSGWLRLPLLLTVRGTPQGRVAELVYLLYHADGEAAVIEIAGEVPPETAPVHWSALPAEVLRVLRAGAVLGTTFEAALVARLLDEPLGAVLEQFQAAADAGVPLTDRGEGRLALPSDAIAALQSSILPSLLTFWHARLGEILSSAPPAEPVGRPGPGLRPGARSAGAPSEARLDLPQGERDTGPGETRYAPAAGEAAGRAPRPAVQAGPPSHRAGDPTRAASHLQAAGHTEEAVAHYLMAVRQAAAGGDVRRAYDLAEQALTLLATLPASTAQALLRTQLWLEKGRLQWQGALHGAALTLQEALTSLEAARAALPPDAPPEVVEQLAVLTAGVCYDVGEREVMLRALAELRQCSDRLVRAGEGLRATRLLNDQAALYLRLGDPVRATYLLSQSRERFEGHLRQQPQDAMALEELADTEHLLARLPLHVPVPANQQDEAYARGLEHAQAAEHTYQRLGQQRALARVWETMGRLLLQQGHLEAARERLSAAVNLLQQLGDLPGLARATAALAELCLLADRLGDAVALLTDSITLNFEKGSTLGLAFNRQTLGALTSAVARVRDSGAERLREAVAHVESRLAQAESILGRVDLPGEAGAAWGRQTPPARAER